MLANIGGASVIDPNDPMARMITEATKHYSLALPQPEQIDAKQLTIPVYAALAENSTVHDSQKAYENAVAVKTIQVKIWRKASHSLPMEFAEQLDHEILDFMKNHE